MRTVQCHVILICIRIMLRVNVSMFMCLYIFSTLISLLPFPTYWTEFICMRSCIQILHGMPLNKSVPSISDKTKIAASTKYRCRIMHSKKNQRRWTSLSGNKQKYEKIVWHVCIYVFIRYTRTFAILIIHHYIKMAIDTQYVKRKLAVLFRCMGKWAAIE